jgi:hypothetical protein
VTPAQLLERLDTEARGLEDRARSLRTASDRLRCELATCSALLGEAAPSPSPEPVRRRGRPSRGSPTTTRLNGSPGAPAPPGEGTPKVDRRRTRRRYPVGASKAERDLLRLREEHPDLAAAVDRGERSLRSAKVAVGWIKAPPAKATAPETLEEPAPAVLEEPDPETPAPLEETETAPLEEPLEEPPPADPEPKPKRRMRDYSRRDTTWSPADVYTPGQRDQDFRASDVTPANPELAEELERGIQAENAAVAEAEARRKNRLNSEPEVKWTEGVCAAI